MNIKSWFKRNSNIGAGAQFFTFTGDKCTPRFTVDFNSIYGINDAYDKCSTLKAIVNRMALVIANVKLWILDDAGNDMSDKYKDLATLLKRPNFIQTWPEFIQQLDVYRQLYGEAFIYASVPIGFNNANANALWVLNPLFIDIESNGRLYDQSDIENIGLRYIFNSSGQRRELDPSNVLHIKDVNQNIDFAPNDLRGSSRLLGLETSLANIIQAEEAIYTMNRDRGAIGILSNDQKDISGTIPLTDEEKESLRNQYQSLYGLSARQAKVIITNASLKWQSISFNVKDLMLLEGIEKNIQLIADALGYPYDLLSTSKGVTYENKAEAKKLLYQDSIIPIANLYAEKLTGFFGLENAKLEFDFSDIECLKKSEKEAAETLYQLNQAMQTAYNNGVISRAEWRLAIGMDEDVYKPEQLRQSGTLEESNTTKENEQERGDDSQPKE